MKPARAAFRRLFLFLLGSAAAALAIWAWCRRVELFVKPGLWREIRALEAARERGEEAAAFEVEEEGGLSRFDVFLSRLIRLERPGFLGGSEFLLKPLRSREGKRCFVAISVPLDTDFETLNARLAARRRAKEEAAAAARARGEEEAPEVVNFVMCYCKTHEIFALDGAGNVLGDPLRVKPFQGPGKRPYGPHRAFRGGPDVLLIPMWGSCRECWPLEMRPYLEVSVDRKGLVPHGLLSGDELFAPVCAPPAREGEEIAGAEDPHEEDVIALLASGTPGDLHRALNLIEPGGRKLGFLAAELLAHADPLIRARAAVVASSAAETLPQALALLADPEPMVRASAMVAGRRAGDWKAILRPLLADPDWRIVHRARAWLGPEEDEQEED